jgi:hypothetical protein
MRVGSAPLPRLSNQTHGKMPGAKVGDGTSLLEEIDQISLIKVSYLETETIHNLTN